MGYFRVLRGDVVGGRRRVMLKEASLVQKQEEFTSERAGKMGLGLGGAHISASSSPVLDSSEGIVSCLGEAD